MAELANRSCSSVLLRTFATLCVHSLAFGALLFVFGNVVPGYVICFERFGVELPTITIPVFNVSKAVVQHWYTLILAAIIFDPPIVAVLAYSPRLGRWFSTPWNTAILLVTILGLFFATVAVYLPLRSLSSEVLAP